MLRKAATEGANMEHYFDDAANAHCLSDIFSESAMAHVTTQYRRLV